MQSKYSFVSVSIIAWLAYDINGGGENTTQNLGSCQKVIPRRNIIIETAIEIINKQAKASELEVSYSKTGRLQVKMFGQDKKTYPLHTEGRGTNKQRLNPSLPKQMYTSLSLEREVLIARKEREIEIERKKFVGNPLILLNVRRIGGLPMMTMKTMLKEKEEEKG